MAKATEPKIDRRDIFDLMNVYTMLDDFDRGQVRGTAKTLLKSDKYLRGRIIREEGNVIYADFGHHSSDPLPSEPSKQPKETKDDMPLLKSVIRSQFGTKKAFADAVGISSAQLSHILNDDCNIPCAFTEKTMQVLGLRECDVASLYIGHYPEMHFSEKLFKDIIDENILDIVCQLLRMDQGDRQAIRDAAKSVIRSSKYQEG